MIENKSILIIGGTGALGKTLVERYHKNNTIIVFSRNEHKQEAMKLVYPNTNNIKYRLGDVKNKNSVLKALNLYNPDIVINTAAVKTVWVCQDNPFESVETNIIGHQNVIEAIQEAKHRPESVIFISTDKACKPVNVYGMCKAIAEQLYIDFAKKQKDTKVVMVRYGNVINFVDRSLIPFFRRLIDEGKEYLPITDFQMTRFLITLTHAVDLIEYAYYHPDSHGKIIVPKLRSFKIVDIANQIIKHSKNPNVKLQKTFIQNGEKLHEEMVSEIEFQRTIDLGNYYMIGYENINENYNQKPFNSQYNLVPDEDVEKLLKQMEVI